LPDAIAAGDRATEAHAYYLLDWALSELGDDASLDYRELAQPIYEELGDFAGLAAVLQNRGVDALTGGRWDESCAYFEDGVTASRRAGDLMRMAQCWQNLAEVRVEQGRYVEGEAFLRDARRSCRASGHAMGFAAATNTLGRTLARAGRADEGVALLLEAQQRFMALGHGPFLAETEARLAEALVFAGRNAHALDVLDELGERAHEGGAPVAALAQRMRATVVARSGDTDGARDLLIEARRIADKGGAEWESALAALEMARLADTSDDERELLLHEADAVLRRMGIDASRVMPPAPPRNDETLMA
jgi:tetratricopeptide (TPR) repeat protein